MVIFHCYVSSPEGKLPFRVPFPPYSDTKSAPFDDLAVGELPGVFSLGVSTGPAVMFGHIINETCGNEMGIIYSLLLINGIYIYIYINLNLYLSI